MAQQVRSPLHSDRILKVYVTFCNTNRLSFLLIFFSTSHMFCWLFATFHVFLLTFYTFHVFLFTFLHIPGSSIMVMSVGCKPSHSTLDGVNWGHLEALLGEDIEVSNYWVVHPEIGKNVVADPRFLWGEGGMGNTREVANLLFLQLFCRKSTCKQGCIPVGCVPPEGLTTFWEGMRVSLLRGSACPMALWKGRTLWTDKHLWKHYLPAISFAGGNDRIWSERGRVPLRPRLDPPLK